MKDRSTAIVAYLQKWGESSADRIAGSIGDLGDGVEMLVVIPACCELRLLPAALDSLPPQAMGIVVLNARVNADADVHRENAALWMQLEAELESPCASEHGIWGRRNGVPLLVVDKAKVGRRLDPRSGVGEARKLGCDIACAIAAQHDVPWIFSTDADARLPASLNTALRALPLGTVAASWPYRHEWDPMAPDEATEALALYELSLRHYTAGLLAAGSPYAFPTLGSAIAVRPWAYAAVRGFPRRQAGEDFYLLNKLAKLGPIEVPSVAPVLITGRASDRVPFGTGPAMQRIASQGLDVEFKLYHPGVFQVIGALQQALSTIPRDATPNSLAADLVSSTDVATLSLSHTSVATMLEAWAKGFKHLQRQGRTQAMRTHQMQTFVDAFRTLKLIHALRDDGLAMMPWREALGCSDTVTPFEAIAAARKSTRQGYTAGLTT